MQLLLSTDTGEQDSIPVLRCCSANQPHRQMVKQTHTSLSASPLTTCLLLASVLQEEIISVNSSLDLLHRHPEDTSLCPSKCPTRVKFSSMQMNPHGPHLLLFDIRQKLFFFPQPNFPAKYRETSSLQLFWGLTR